MEELILKVDELRRGDVRKTIDGRMKEFVKIGQSEEKIFSELCFCLLTANFQAEKSILIQKEIEKDFFEASEGKLKKKLKELGHRFWPQRAERIILARKKKDELLKVVMLGDEFVIRDWIVENVKGIGMKEASHFLRNIGFNDVAIIDFHIVDLLVREGGIESFKSLNKGKYFEIESVLRDLGEKVGLSLGELDLYLWYIETGKVLK